MRQDSVFRILFAHDSEQFPYKFILSVLATLAPGRSPLGYPILVPHFLSSKRAELVIESRHARFGMEFKTLCRDQTLHGETRIPVRPVAFGFKSNPKPFQEGGLKPKPEKVSSLV